MILIGLGSNLAGPWGNPRQMVEQALRKLDVWPMRLIQSSSLIDTDPHGKKNQPRYVNAVAEIATSLGPDPLMKHLLAIERSGGRRRRIPMGPRTIDLDILDYHGLHLRQNRKKAIALVLPHPAILQRSFVLKPLAEIAPRWRHPGTHLTARQLLKRLP